MSSSIPPSTPGKMWQPPSPEELQPELPAYEILGLLGRGGMGAVYRARQKSLKREVAIKVLPPTIEDGDMHFAERFKAEAESMARLNHPGIIAVYDAGETSGGLLYFVMEFVQGTDVAHMISASGKLPPEHAHAIAAHVCDALAYAHENGLIHRDIKPANIMVDTQGRVKVADFGLAKAANDTQGFTQSNMAVGTPDFVAPETLMGGVPVDGRADLYAVGVMLYQMLTGEIPRGAWHPPSVRVPGIDRRFDDIVVKAMQVDRDARHSSALELRQHLDSLLMPAVPAPDLQRYSSAGMPRRDVAASARTQNPPPARSAADRSRARQDVEVRPQASAASPDHALASAATKKSKAPLLVGIGVAAAVAVGAFVFRSGSRHTSDDRPRASASTPGQTLASPATSKSTPIKVREEPKPASSGSRQTSDARPANAPPTDQTLASSATKGSAPKPEPEKKEEPKPVAAAPVMPAPATAPAISNSKSPVSDSSPPAAAPHPKSQIQDLKLQLPPELAALDAQFIKLQAERVTSPFAIELATLNSNYLRGIAQKVTEEKAAGNLDAILALDAETKLVPVARPSMSGSDAGSGQGLEALATIAMPVPETDDEKTPASLKGLRAIYRTAYAKLAATRAANLKALTDPLGKRLAQMESDLAKADRVADAKTVRGYREALSESNRIGHDVAAVPGGSTSPPDHALAGAATKPLSPAATLALKDGFTNSLGMKFIPVKGTDVLFCIHETRYKDYAAYAADAPGVDGTWKSQTVEGYTPTENKEDHPVMNVSWEEAQQFCAWLSMKEGKTYRLPTDQEWSYAVGIGRDEKRKKDATPATVFKNTTDFPWGDKWPPPKGSGNYSDESRHAKAPGNNAPYLEGYDDGYPTTAPVMSFKPNKLGLYDMGGNVWEWCEDLFDNGNKERVLRAGSWYHHERTSLLSSYRNHVLPGERYDFNGFRLVLAPSGPTPATQPPATVGVEPQTTPRPVNPAAMLALKDGITNSLGMKLVLVPGTEILMCIYETRWKDFAAYAGAVSGVNGSWRGQSAEGVKLTERAEEHPVANVSWEDARGFCAWLSQKEGKTYRLPTDKEWSFAVGLGRDEKWKADTTPDSLSSRVPNEYPWGNQWPPPKGVGNYSDLSRKNAAKAANIEFIDGYDDGHPTTAPVMSFAPNQLGIHDLGGNVNEWCADWLNATQKERVLRGDSWFKSNRSHLLSSFRGRDDPEARRNFNGFRIVMEVR